MPIRTDVDIVLEVLRLLAAVELLVGWIAWWYPFLFRAPHVQKRPSITVAGPTRVGLLLETAAIFLGFIFRVPGGETESLWRIVASMAISPFAVAMAFGSVTHLGRQFRLHAGLYEDHQLVRTGPYAVVRHPIYASLFAMMIASLLLFTQPVWIAISVAMFVAGTEIRIQSEEKLLAGRFGAAFDDYRRSVRAYIPFVR